MKFKVKLLSNTPLEVAVKAALMCTGNEGKADEYMGRVEDFLGKLVQHGHESVIEHINYSFEVSGVSRALLQELARHRHISLSVQSTRWALKKIKDNEVIFSTDEDNIQDEEQMKLLDELKAMSKELTDKIKKAIEAGIPNDIAKYYLQEGFTTKLVLTLNARELRHIFRLRTSPRALKEFRLLCVKLYEAIPKEHKFLFKEFFIKENEVN